MKKHLFAALAILAIAACNKPGPEGPDGPETIDAKQINVTFKSADKAFALNDVIVVFNGVSGEDRNAPVRYQCTTLEGNVATFEFLADGDVTEINKNLSEIVALYPVQEASYDSTTGKLSYNFDGAQSFVAKGSPKSTIEFTPTCGQIDLKLSGLSTINSVEVESSLAIRGDAVVDMSAAAPALAVVGEAKAATITLVPAVVLTEEGIAISMVFPAGAYENITFDSKDANGGNMETSAENVTVKVGETTVVTDTYFIPTPVESVDVTISKYITATSKTIDLTGNYTVLPADATNRKVTFASSDEAVATVSGEGVVTAKSVGDAVITIASEEDASKNTTITVRVADIPEYAEVTKSTPVTIESCDALTYMTKKGSKGTAVASTGETVEGTLVSPKEGSAFFFNTSEKSSPEWMAFCKTSSAVNGKILGANRAHLTFWFYISNYIKDDGTKVAFKNRLNATGGHIEITSTGNNARGPYWTTETALKTRVLQADGTYGCVDYGWNFIDLPFMDAFHNEEEWKMGDGYLNTAGINYFRFYLQGSAAACTWDIYNFGFDDIAIYEDYTQETTAEKEYLHTLNDLSGMNGYYNAADRAVGNSFNDVAGASVLYIQLDEDAPLASKATKRYGHLHFKMYVSDISAFSDAKGQFELTSSGTCDKEEISWQVSKVAPCLHNGWNDVVLDFNRTDGWDDAFNPANVNFFRFYEFLKAPCTIMFKDVYLFNETF